MQWKHKVRWKVDGHKRHRNTLGAGDPYRPAAVRMKFREVSEMSDVELQARVIALEAALQAVLLTRSNPSEAHRKFTDIWTDNVRGLNNASSENQPLTQAIQAVCGRLDFYVRHYAA